MVKKVESLFLILLKLLQQFNNCINQNIFHFLNNLFLEEIDTIVVGYSKNLDGTDSDISTEIENFICKLNSNYPTKKIRTVDERFASKIAFRS